MNSSHKRWSNPRRPAATPRSKATPRSTFDLPHVKESTMSGYRAALYVTALTDAKRSEMERMDSIMFQNTGEAMRGKHLRMPA